MAAELPTFDTGTLKASDLQALVVAIRELQQNLDQGGGGDNSDDGNDPTIDIYDTCKNFIAKITGNGSNGTVYTWDEQTNANGTISPFGTPGTDGRQCANASHASAAIELNGATYIANGTIVSMIELGDPPDNRYQFQKTDAVFTITGPFASANATNFSPYVTSEGASVYNQFEPCSNTTMGVTINANGTVGNGTCVVKAIGNIRIPCQWDKTNSKWIFAASNNAS